MSIGSNFISSFLDILICLLLALNVWVLANVIGFFTFGIIKKTIPFILPVILIVYYVYSLGGRKGITFGMKLFKTFTTLLFNRSLVSESHFLLRR